MEKKTKKNKDGGLIGYVRDGVGGSRPHTPRKKNAKSHPNPIPKPKTQQQKNVKNRKKSKKNP